MLYGLIEDHTEGATTLYLQCSTIQTRPKLVNFIASLISESGIHLSADKAYHKYNVPSDIAPEIEGILEKKFGLSRGVFDAYFNVVPESVEVFPVEEIEYEYVIQQHNED